MASRSLSLLVTSSFVELGFSEKYKCDYNIYRPINGFDSAVLFFESPLAAKHGILGIYRIDGIG